MKDRRLRMAYFRPAAYRPVRTGRWVSWLDQQCVRARVRLFARRLIRLAETLPMTGAAGLCGDELLLSAGLIRTSCQAALKAASAGEFRRKLRVVTEEAVDCAAWLELLGDTGVLQPAQVEELTEEADELLAVTTHVLHAAKDVRPRTGGCLRIVRPWQDRRRGDSA